MVMDGLVFTLLAEEHLTNILTVTGESAENENREREGSERMPTDE